MVREFIIKTRLKLTAAGWDAGPLTIAWHLDQAGLHVPSTSTIRRILHAAGLVTSEPRKRPLLRCSAVGISVSRLNRLGISDSSVYTTPYPLAASP